MKKIILLGLLALGLGALAPKAGAVANQARTLSDGVDVPKDKNGTGIVDLSFLGAAVSTRSAGGTQTLNAAGTEAVDKQWTNQPGILYDVELASGTATTEFVICIDTDNANGTDLSLTQPDWDTYNILMVCNRSATVSQGCYAGYRPWPRFFRLGLACRSSVDREYVPIFREAD